MSIVLEASNLDDLDGPETSGLGSLVVVARQHGLHLTVPQLIHDNVLDGNTISSADLIRCATRAKLSAKSVQLDWESLRELKKALPAIVRLKSGSCMVLLELRGGEDDLRVVLQDPNAGDDALLYVDETRFSAAWTGEVILVKRNYDIADETQPFSIGLITALIFRERRTARDIVVCAVLLGFLALTPIMFWRLLSDKVIYYKAYNTFTVICLAMLMLTAFEAVFYYLRQSMVQFLTTRLDVKLSTYMFVKVPNLPMDYSERTQIALVARDMREIFKIRTFLVGQMFGTILDSATLIFFIPVMFFFSPIMTFVVLGFAGLMVGWLILMLPTYRKRTAAVMAAEGEQGSFLFQTLNGIRTIKSLSLDARQRHQWDVLVAKTAKARVAE